MGKLDTIGARVLAVRKETGKTQAQMALFLGLANATWQKIERNEGLPNGETLLSFERLGVNPGWILTGLGPRHLNEDAVTSPVSGKLDPHLMEKLYKTVEQAYKNVGQRPPGHRLAYDTAMLFNELLGRVKDVQDDTIVDLVAPKLAGELIERLRTSGD